MTLAGTTADAQVVSVQPRAPLDGSDFAASARLQHGTTDRENYILGLLPNAQITSSSPAVVGGTPGGAAGTAFPLPWGTIPPGNATFRLQYNAALGRLFLSIRDSANNLILQRNILVNFSTAGGVNLNFGGLGSAVFGGLSVTSGAITAAIGPSGNWSGTDLSSSTLTGWNLNANWQINGFFQFPASGGTGALPRLQFDVLNQGLAYQLSDQGGTGRPAVANYGRIQDMVVTAAEFQQAQFGGTDGVLETQIFSRAAVTFDIAAGNSVELAGGLFDLQGVPNVEPANFGDASFVKDGDGTLVLSGANSFGGGTSVVGGTLVLGRSGALATSALSFLDAALRFEPDPAIGAGQSIAVAGDLSLDPAASLESNLSLVPDASGAPGLLSCDRIAVAGTAVLGGDVRLVLDLRLCDEPLIPPPGETRRWVPIDCSAANSATGAPSSVTLRVIGEDGHPEDLALAVNASVVADGARFDTIAGPAGLAVAVTRDVPACAGDLDGNGSIDGADLSTLLAAWGPAPTPRPEDLNADGQVDGADLTTLLAGWGACG